MSRWKLQPRVHFKVNHGGASKRFFVVSRYHPYLSWIFFFSNESSRFLSSVAVCGGGVQALDLCLSLSLIGCSCGTRVGREHHIQKVGRGRIVCSVNGKRAGCRQAFLGRATALDLLKFGNGSCLAAATQSGQSEAYRFRMKEWKPRSRACLLATNLRQWGSFPGESGKTAIHAIASKQNPAGTRARIRLRVRFVFVFNQYSARSTVFLVKCVFTFNRVTQLLLVQHRVSVCPPRPETLQYSTSTDSKRVQSRSRLRSQHVTNHSDESGRNENKLFFSGQEKCNRVGLLCYSRPTIGCISFQYARFTQCPGENCLLANREEQSRKWGVVDDHSRVALKCPMWRKLRPLD
jgi:hypothetical protein